MARRAGKAAHTEVDPECRRLSTGTGANRSAREFERGRAHQDSRDPRSRYRRQGFSSNRASVWSACCALLKTMICRGSQRIPRNCARDSERSPRARFDRPRGSAKFRLAGPRVRAPPERGGGLPDLPGELRWCRPIPALNRARKPQASRQAANRRNGMAARRWLGRTPCPFYSARAWSSAKPSRPRTYLDQRARSKKSPLR